MEVERQELHFALGRVREVDGCLIVRRSLKPVRTDDMNDEFSTCMSDVEEDASSYGFNGTVQSLPKKARSRVLAWLREMEKLHLQ